MQPSQRKEFLSELCETENFIAQRRAAIKQRKGSKAPPDLQFDQPSEGDSCVSSLLNSLWDRLNVQTCQAFSFVDLVGVEAVTEVEADSIM